MGNDSLKPLFFIERTSTTLESSIKETTQKFLSIETFINDSYQIFLQQNQNYNIQFDSFFSHIQFQNDSHHEENPNISENEHIQETKHFVYPIFNNHLKAVLYSYFDNYQIVDCLTIINSITWKSQSKLIQMISKKGSESVSFDGFLMLSTNSLYFQFSDTMQTLKIDTKEIVNFITKDHNTFDIYINKTNQIPIIANNPF